MYALTFSSTLIAHYLNDKNISSVALNVNLHVICRSLTQLSFKTLLHSNHVFRLAHPSHSTSVVYPKLVASSDHSAVLFKLAVASNSAELDSFLKPKLIPTPNLKKFNLALAERLLSFIDWHSLFAPCVSIDDYWNAFKFQCLM